MQERIDDYLQFGVRYVWLINRRKRRAFIYSSEGVLEAKDGILYTTSPDLLYHQPRSPRLPGRSRLSEAALC
jgi:Uma2 family endonuclease